MTSRRSPITSAGEAVRIMRDAHKQIVAPSHVPLDPGDMPFFENVLDEFARASWTPHQVEMAALLARSLHDFAVEQMMMRDEGAVVQGDKGMVPNPRKAIMQMHSNNIISFRRSLAMHATAKGKVDDIAKRTVMSHKIQAQSPLDDELLARA